MSATADEALAKAKEIAARLSGSSGVVAAPASMNPIDVANAVQAASSTNGSTPTERKRKRWGVSDDAKEALPGLDLAAKKLKEAEEPIEKRVWVNTNEKPASHYVAFLNDNDNAAIRNIVAQVGGDDVKIDLRGRGSGSGQKLLGMPEEPLHVLIQGPPDKTTRAEPLVDDLLRQAENAPLMAAPEPPSQNAELSNAQLAEKITADAADAVALATSGSTSAPSAAGYKPAPVAALIGQMGSQGSSSGGGHYGPAGGTGEMFEEQIGVPNGIVGFIIGRGGESITSMQARSGCKVQIQKEHDMTPGQTQRVITLTSNSKESIDMCRGMIETMVQDRVRAAGGGGMQSSAPMSGAASQAAKLQEAISLGHALVTVKVPDADVGLIIGKGGMNIKSIQDRSGANVQIPQIADVDNPQVRTVNVTHPHQEGANLAKELIEQLLASKASNQANANVTMHISIPDQDVGMCIGRGGCVIKEMQNQTGTRIQIPSQPTPGQPHRIATVVGSHEGCQQVQQMIDRIIQEQSSQSVMAGVAYQGGGGGYNQGYGQQQGYGQHQGYGQYNYGDQQQQAASGQQDYSAEWAAYYAAQAAAQGGASAPAPAATATDTTQAASSTGGGDAQPAADAYYEQFFRYAYHYGEEAARQYYGAWSPPQGTPNPYGTNPNAGASTGAPAAGTAAPAPAAPADAQTSETAGDSAAMASAMGARDSSVRKQSNLPAWMTKGTG